MHHRQENIELICGDFTDEATGLMARGKGAVACVISDPPYSDRTHSGQSSRADGSVETVIAYEHLTGAQAERYAGVFSYAAVKWSLVMTDHMLFADWERGFKNRDGYTFPPLPCVIRGMTVRLQGDGPSSWTVWLAVNRPRGLMDGTKPGAYVGGRGSDDNPVKGSKPLWLMEAIIRDYTEPGDLVCDPCMGGGTTGVAALRLGRRFLGWEKDPATYEYAKRRILGTEPLPQGFHASNQGALAL